ncbi:type-F conjugative transfer system pilin assembly protein TrbC [Candidatus Regiella insecticola]|nr:type-F conjugative transfer system pilin assembly protein TrbC [Candidatus Regiella insecticola]
MSILLASQVIATEDGGTQQFLEQQLKQSETGRSREDFDFLQKLTLPMQAQDQPFIDAMQQRQQQQGSGEIKPVAKALYFVSFSIPIEGLKQMVHDADQYPIPVTLRGLLNNDLRQTANAVLSLVKEGKRGGGGQIDPVSFRTYGITAVPALVDGVINPALPRSRLDRGHSRRMGIAHFPALFLVEPKDQRYQPLAYGFMTQDALARQFLAVATGFKPHF